MSDRCWVLGVDIGSARDGLALCVGVYERLVPKRSKANPFPTPTVAGSLTYCESVPGTDYSDMPAVIADLAVAVAEQMPEGDRLYVSMDITGSGRPVGPATDEELRRREWPSDRPRVYQVVITAGQAIKAVPGTQQVNASRVTLLEEWVMATRAGAVSIKLPREQAKALQGEMKAYARRNGRADHAASGHDDRIVAACLSYLGAKLAFAGRSTVHSATNTPVRRYEASVWASSTPANPDWDGRAHLEQYKADMAKRYGGAR